jgi:hypothetical protein
MSYDNLVVIITFFSCVLLCAVYFTEPWWRSYIGVNLFGKTAAIAAVLLPAVLARLHIIEPLAPWTRVYEAIVFTFVPLFVLQRTYLLIRAKWRRTPRQTYKEEGVQNGRREPKHRVVDKEVEES